MVRVDGHKPGTTGSREEAEYDEYQWCCQHRTFQPARDQGITEEQHTDDGNSYQIHGFSLNIATRPRRPKFRTRGFVICKTAVS